MKAHGWASCSVQPSFSMLSSFFFQPLPIRYTQGGGQKNLNQHKRALKKKKNNTQTNGALGIVPHGPLLIAVRLLCNFCVQYEHRLVVFVLQVIPHSLPEMRGKEHTLYTTCTQHVHKSGLHFQCVGGGLHGVPLFTSSNAEVAHQTSCTNRRKENPSGLFTCGGDNNNKA